jgi:hypothetical protein
MSARGEWYNQPARKRKAPFVAFVFLVFVACGAGLYVVMRLTEPPPKAAASSTKSTIVAAPDDPATLQPLVLAGSTPAADVIFSARLTAFVLALDQSVKTGTPGEGEDVARTGGALTAPDVGDAIGAKAAAALAEVVSAAKEAARGASQLESATQALDLATTRLDNALIADRMPYFMDAMVGFETANGRRLVPLYGFSIVASDLFESGEARVRSVRLRRLDRLNWSHVFLGFLRWSRPQAMVLLDQIDEHLVNLVLPSLPDGASMPMRDPDDVDPAAEANTSSAEGGKGVRADIAALPGVDPGAVRELGEALRTRRALFVKWNERLKDSGRKIKNPPRLALDVAELEREARGLLPRVEIDELRKIQKRLGRGEVERAYETIRDAFSASVERHEVQHRLDALRPLPRPVAIDELMPATQTPAGERRRDKIQMELSGYLSQIARDDLVPHVTFSLFVRFLVDPKLRGLEEAYAAIAAVEALAPELGATDVGHVFHDHKFDEDRILRAHQYAVAARGPDLSAAARRVWGRLFGVELGPLAGGIAK